MLNLVVFYILAGIAVLSAALLLAARNTRHCVVLLSVVLLATSGVFLQLQSRVLFAVQLLLLAGVMMAMFLVAVTQVDADGTLRELRFARQKWVVLAIAGAAGAEAGLVYWSVRKRPLARLLALGATQVERLEPNARVVLRTLFSTYLLSFEIAAVLVFVAAVAAIAVNRRRA